MAKESFRVGIVGAGNIAVTAHLPAWKRIEGVTIAGIADLDPARAQAAARAHGIPIATDAAEELFDLGLDAIDLCTPNRAHASAALAALERRIPVLCEKPIAPTTAEVRQMGELADRNGVILMAAQQHRFGAPAQALRRWMREDGVGKPYHSRVRAMRRSRLPVAPGFIDAALSGGGPSLDIGVHALDLCLWLLDFPRPLRVTGATRANFAKGWGIPGEWGEWDRRRFNVEDFAAGFVHFEQGLTLVFESAWLGHQAAPEEISCEIFGLQGSIQWPTGDYATARAGSYVHGRIENPLRVPDAYEAEIRAFHQAVTQRLPSPVPWQESEKVIAVLEAIHASQREGREVRLPEA